ncbi:hypothetical protein BH23BAC1_BH23BAC1_20560 [soil metagenome]
MTKTILIPTDFTIESLNIVKSALSKNDGEHLYNIIFLHGRYLSTSITERLFFSKKELLESLSNPEFEDAFNIIRNKYYSQINSILQDIFSGFNQAAFNNYLEGNGIDEAYIPADHKLNIQSKKSFDIIPLLLNSDLIVHEIKRSKKVAIPEKGRLAEVFFNEFIR